MYRFTGTDDATKKVHQLLLDEQDGVSDLQIIVMFIASSVVFSLKNLTPLFSCSW